MLRQCSERDFCALSVRCPFGVVFQDVICTRVFVSTVEHELFQLLDVVSCNLLGIGEVLCDTLWNSNFLDAQVGIWPNDGTAREVNTLSRQVLTETSTLALQPLRETAHCLLQALLFQAWCVAVDVHGNLQLQEVPLLHQDLQWKASRKPSPYDAADLADISNLVCHIIFGRTSLLHNRWAQSNGWYRHVLPDQHLRSCIFWNHSQQLAVLWGDFLEQVEGAQRVHVVGSLL